MKPKVADFTESGDPWDGIEMPEGFNPDSNPFLNPPSYSEEIVLLSSIGDERKTQDEWRVHTKAFYSAKYFASAPDYYNAFKFLTFASRGEQMSAGTRIEQVKDLLKNRQFVMDTRIEYKPDSEDADILHALMHKGSCRVPVYQGADIEDIVADTAGLNFLRHLFGIPSDKWAKDDADTIVHVMQNMFGDRNVVFTPEIEARKSGPYACSLIYDPSGPRTDIGCDLGLIVSAYALAATYKSEASK